MTTKAQAMSGGITLFRSLFRKLQKINDPSHKILYQRMLKDEFRQHADETDPDRLKQISDRSKEDVDWIVPSVLERRHHSRSHYFFIEIVVMSKVHVLPNTPHLRAIMSTLRSIDTPPPLFAKTADLIARMVVAAGLDYLPYEDVDIVTPTKAVYAGKRLAKKVCGVSILRAGESMERILREWLPSVVIGKVLIQRCEETATPKFIFDKLPISIKECHVILLDPMLATGGSAMKAIEVLHERGVPFENIIFCNIMSSPEGLEILSKRFPDVTVVTAEVDSHLNEEKYIIPGLGDYGDRYFGTM
eukprot:gene5396-8876_t